MDASGSGALLEHVSFDLKRSREVVLRALQNDGCAFMWASETLRADVALAGAAVANDSAAIEFALGAAADDKGVILSAV